jgi:hypothetical protein
MKLEKLSAVAELVSSVAVVATLVYLAIQTQQTNSALRANSRAATMSADIAFLTASFGGADINATLLKSSEDLTDADANRLVQWLAALARIREFAWFQYQSGVIDEEALRSYLTVLVDTIQWPSMTNLWQHEVSAGLDPRFVAYVNGLRGEYPVVSAKMRRTGLSQPVQKVDSH